MQAPKVNELDLDSMLERAEITTGILRVVYALQEIKDYTKENAAQELLEVLNDRGYLDHGFI
ncbi:hypothetical protein H9655_20685 [Cytobacillus sp. Sa5YUA1]|uniref:Uncharacterized protein n=1 Tax=Cytobacillus stercorigallinarum TaxID=2762240 RepID=A0ABR8QVI7_9BACI|nr:hypothetical protein [Cytobacillus stercorigallinarum]MBD7939462.1 hypothetical protein [Cytobacillus stercorigallinarum]